MTRTRLGVSVGGGGLSFPLGSASEWTLALAHARSLHSF